MKLDGQIYKKRTIEVICYTDKSLWKQMRSRFPNVNQIEKNETISQKAKKKNSRSNVARQERSVGANKVRALLFKAYKICKKNLSGLYRYIFYSTKKSNFLKIFP